MPKLVPKIYAKRPACKWHASPCHRPVAAGNTLCAYHLPMARTAARIDYALRPGYHGKLTPDQVDDLAGHLVDPGCDCPDCLRGVQPGIWPDTADDDEEP